MGAAESSSIKPLDIDSFDLYKVLDISEDASEDDIKVCVTYKHHPMFSPLMRS
jgi:preprotein translocase subunit Sec63